MHLCALVLFVALAAVSAVPPKGCYDDHGQWYNVGPIPTHDNCKTCKCWDNGQIKCDVVHCPKPYCPKIAQYYNKGDCCASCKPGCDLDRWYWVGDYVPSRDHCEKCECGKDGKPVCHHVGCPSLKCPYDFQVKDKGACCKRCLPACVDHGKWIKIGAYVDNGNKCDSCYCQKNGKVGCQPKPCPVPKCPAQFQVLEKGACCKTCLPYCSYYDRYFKVGEEVDNGNKCDTCYCGANGEVNCKKNPCKPLNCPKGFQVKDHYECCPRCLPACIVHDKWFKIGEQVPGGKCEDCWCGDHGKVQCKPYPCRVPKCPAEFQVKDGCCKKCKPACVIYDKWYKIGGPVPSNNKCDSCWCGDYGKVQCKPNPCPEPKCPYEFQLPDGCCKKCAPACVDKDRWYKIGAHVYNGDKCSTCYCAKSGKIECSVNPCPGLKCPGDFQVLAKGACCKHCKPACVIKGNWFHIGAEVPSGKCETCWCGDYGKVSCKPNPCPAPKCPYDFQVQDGCCKSCKPACIDDHKNWYHIGAPTPSGKCDSCKCTKSGKIACTPNPCPVPKCPPAFQVPHGCCKSCKPACVIKDTWYKIGSEVPSGKCESCWCGDYGKVSCKPNPCPVPKCPYDFQVQDGCCKKCKPACIDGHNNWYPIGAPTPSGKCESCKCTYDGKIVCTPNPCPEPKCPYDFQVKKGCCKACKPACVDGHNNWHHIGAPTPSGKCESCKCTYDGKIVCTPNPCPEPKCPYDFQVQDGCCKACKPACIDGHNNWYHIGAPAPSGKCNSCKCTKSGRIACAPNPCPEPKCPYDFQVKKGCCKACKPACVDGHNNWHHIGAPTPSGKCESCKCTYDGKIVCTPNPCPEPKCPYDFQVKKGCCKACKPACIDGHNNWHHIGAPTPSGKCESCKCTYDGSIVCTPNPCPEPKCPYEFQVQDGCCKKCLPACIDKKGNWYKIGSYVAGGKCESCKCRKDGSIGCTPNPCPEPKCPYDFQVPHGCCKACKPACIDNANNWFHIGSQVPGGKCETCKCTYDGKIVCTPNPCPALKCPAKLQVPDGCCKKCKPHCVDQHNNWYLPGATVPGGKCENCHCGANGHINCQPNPCPKLKCDPKYWVTDEYGCCKKCAYKKGH